MMKIAIKINTTILYGSCVLLSLVNHAQADNNTDTLVVTGTRTEKRIWDSSVSAYVLDRETLERNNSDSIGEALRDIPGIEIYDNATAGRKQIIIRGESPSHVLMLVDGQEVSYQRSGHGSGAGLLIDPDSIERIEVIKGPHSVLYGSQAIGGVINFITKKGSSDKQAFSGHLKSIYDGSSSGFTQLGSAYGTLDNFSYRISGNYSDYGDKRTPEGRLKNTDFGNKGLSSWFGYHFNQHSFGLALESYKLHTQTYNNNDNSSELKSFLVKLPRVERQKIGLFYDYVTDDHIIKNIHFDVYHQKIARQFRNDLVIEPNPRINNHIKTNTNDQQHSQGINLQTDFQFNDHVKLVTGAQYLQDKVKQNSHKHVDFTSRIIPSYQKDVNSRNQWQQSSISLFGQNEWKINDKLVWNIGLRKYWLESKVLSGASKTTQIYPSGQRPNSVINSKDKRKQVHDNTLVISSGMTYEVDDNNIFRASFAQGYVYPTLTHLYAVTSAASQTIYGNPHLKAEKSNNFEIGLRHSSDNWIIDTAIFYSSARNYITEMVCNGESVCNGSRGSKYNVYYNNANKAKTYGSEITIEYNQWDVIPYLNTNFMRRKLETPNYKTYSSNTPMINGRVGLRNTHFFSSFDLSSDIYMRFASKSKKRSDNTRYEYNGWSAVNLNLFAEFGDKRQYSLGVDLNNIFNKHYQTAHESIPAAKFHAVVSGSIKF